MPLDASVGLPSGKLIIAVSAQQDHFPQGPCNTTIAEFTINDNGLDSYDISLVNGQNFNMEIASDKPTTNPNIKLDTTDLATIKKTLGVFPPGCSRCVDGVGVPPAWQGNGTTTQNCPGYGKPPGPMPMGSCKQGSESDPKPNYCQITAKPTGANYTVTFTDL
jgi:Thaumatin family